jgi:hypothetical protein
LFPTKVIKPTAQTMILYNITFNLSPDIEEDFLSWMKETHIPEVLATGKFHSHVF